MYSQWITVFPARGHERQTREVLEDWAVKAHQKGRRLAISRRVFYSDAPTFTLVTLHDDLKSLQELQQENATDPDFHEYLANLATCTSRAGTVELYKFLVPPKEHGRNIRYAHGVHVFPAIGKVRETWEILEKQVKACQDNGRPGIRLLQRKFSDNGFAFYVMDTYQDLAESDNTNLVEVIRPANTFMRAPASFSIREFIVPKP